MFFISMNLDLTNSGRHLGEVFKALRWFDSHLLDFVSWTWEPFVLLFATIALINLLCFNEETAVKKPHWGEDLSLIQEKIFPSSKGWFTTTYTLQYKNPSNGFFELRLLHLLQPFTQLQILGLPPPSAPPQLSQSLISSSASAAYENLHGFQPMSFTSIIPSNHFSPQSVCSICSTVREKSRDKVSRWDSSCGKVKPEITTASRSWIASVLDHHFPSPVAASTPAIRRRWLSRSLTKADDGHHPDSVFNLSLPLDQWGLLRVANPLQRCVIDVVLGLYTALILNNCCKPNFFAL